jgi:hypothetical protein
MRNNNQPTIGWLFNSWRRLLECLMTRALVPGAFAVIGAGSIQAASGAITRPRDLDVQT